jgi:Tfp pilus assembly protein PilZ
VLFDCQLTCLLGGRLVMRILKAKYRGGEDLLGSYQGSYLNGGFMVPSRELIPVGESVIIEVRLPELADRMLLRGVVASRHLPTRKSGKAGVWVELLAAERQKRDFLLAIARGETTVSTSRNHRRFPVSLTVDWRVKEGRLRHPATLDDIGAGGAFLRTSELPPAGTPVVIDVVPPGAAAPLSIEARVAWARTSPGFQGLGVEFRCRDTGGLRRLKELVRRLAIGDAEPEPQLATS